MDILALLLYIILAIVLITLVIVIGWLYYDYVELKDNLNSNFSYVRRKFNDHDEKDEDLEEDIGINNDSIVTIDSTINGPPDGSIKEEINDIKAILGEPKSEDGTTDATGYFKVKELVGDFSDADSQDATELASLGLADGLLGTKNLKKTFHNNLHNYFEFGTQNTGVNTIPAADMGNMWSYDIGLQNNDADNKLKLIQDTTIAANMTVNTDTDSSPNKHLKICNNNGSKCYKLYVDDSDNLNIQATDFNLAAGETQNSKLIMGDYTLELPKNAGTRKSLINHTHTYDKYNEDSNGNRDDISTPSGPAVYT